MSKICSIIIPSAGSPVYLEQTLASAFSSANKDEVDVVVMDNAMELSVRDRMLKKYPEIRWFRRETPVSMVENWESAISLGVGDWVTFIGSDDGMVPLFDLELRRHQSDCPNNQIFTWSRPCLHWGNSPAISQRNNFLWPLNHSGNVTCVSRATAEQYVSLPVSHEHLPMIYNSFVRRTLIDRVIQKFGSFYSTNTTSPDLWSAGAFMAEVESFVHLQRPLSINGVSGASNGAASVLGVAKDKKSINYKVNRAPENHGDEPWRTVFGEIINVEDVVGAYNRSGTDRVIRTMSVPEIFRLALTKKQRLKGREQEWLRGFQALADRLNNVNVDHDNVPFASDERLYRGVTAASQNSQLLSFNTSWVNNPLRFCGDIISTMEF